MPSPPPLPAPPPSCNKIFLGMKIKRHLNCPGNNLLPPHLPEL